MKAPRFFGNFMVSYEADVPVIWQFRGSSGLDCHLFEEERNAGLDLWNGSRTDLEVSKKWVFQHLDKKMNKGCPHHFVIQVRIHFEP